MSVGAINFFECGRRTRTKLDKDTYHTCVSVCVCKRFSFTLLIEHRATEGLG